MKFQKFTPLPILLGVSLLFSSCYKHDHNNVTPSYAYQFDDEFNADIHNWSFSDPADAAYVGIANGELNYSYHPSSPGTNTVAIQAGLNVNNDFTIQTSVTTDNTIGLAFGVSNYDYGYAFMIDNNGNYALYYEGSASIAPQPILDWAPSSAVYINDWNTLEIDQVGNSWYGYINQKQVFKIASEYLNGSKIGFITEKNSAGGSESYADYISAEWM